MAAIIGVALLAAAATLFAAIRAFSPDTSDESGKSELVPQLVSVAITGLFAGGLAAMIAFAGTHANAAGLAWLALAVAVTIAAFWLASRIGRSRHRPA